MSFLCDAIYRGSEIVEGAVSPNKLTSLAELVLNAAQSIKGYAEICIDKLPRGERCQLQIDEERLRVSSSRRDEGFESDSESSSTASGSVIEENVCPSPEIKVIQDHVLRLEKLIRQDSGIHHCNAGSFSSKGRNATGSESVSISSSSGAESEDDAPKRTTNQNFGAKSPSQNTDENKLQMENGNGDSFLLSDILFCHVMSHLPKVVIVVVKSVDSDLVAAHLFECLSQEAARTLYNCYYTASNKYKLSRYRLSKRRINDGLASEDKAVLDRIHVSIRNIRRKQHELPPGSTADPLGPQFTSNEINQNHIRFSHGANNGRVLNRHFKNNFNDANNVNIIEIKDPLRGGGRIPNGMMQKIDENGVTLIEIESAPSSLIDPTQDTNMGKLKPSFDCQEALSALDRLSIHSSNNPDSYLNAIGVTSSCPNSLIVTSREIHSTGENEKDRKARQRQPPLLLTKDTFRKVDSMPRKEIRKRGERRNRSRSEERRQENVNNSQLSSTVYDEGDVFLNQYRPQKVSEILFQTEDLQSNTETEFSKERQSRLRSTTRARDEKLRPRSNHNKGPAPPPPPPRKHPSNPSLLLVPTKNGQENSRAYYPKESHFIRGTKLIRIDYPLYPPWNMNSDMNNNSKRVYYSHPRWISSHEYHSNRHIENPIASDIRRRSRSKSPARRPAAHKYMDVVSNFNISQKLKDLSDSVLQTWKNNSPISNNNLTSSAASLLSSYNKENSERVLGRREKKGSPSTPNVSRWKGDEDALRPVIKRGKKIDNSCSDPRRVTFSAYATVQVMEV